MLINLWGRQVQNLSSWHASGLAPGYEDFNTPLAWPRPALSWYLCPHMNVVSVGTEANDALMRSLPELSRETGIPMPLILRFKREHPEKLPSVGSGSQQSFPEGVIPTLLALYEEEFGARPGLEGARRGLLSLVRVRQERTPDPVPAPQESEPESKDLAASELQDESLALRLKRLEERQRKLTAEIKAVIKILRKPLRGEIPLP